MTTQLVKHYEQSVALLTELFPASTEAHALLPENEPFSWRRFDAGADDALVAVQRVNVGRVAPTVLNQCKEALFTQFAATGSGHGFQPISADFWLDREGNQANAHIDHLHVIPLEVFGFAFPEKPNNKRALSRWLRPAFHVIIGRELCDRTFLTDASEAHLFTIGYAFPPAKLRPNPYPYGPGVFERGTKCIDFVQLPNGEIEVRMMAMMSPSLHQVIARKYGKLAGKWIKRFKLEQQSLAVHARIHDHAVRRLFAGTE